MSKVKSHNYVVEVSQIELLAMYRRTQSNLIELYVLIQGLFAAIPVKTKMVK